MILNVSLHPNILVTLLTTTLGVAVSKTPRENQGSSESQNHCDTTAGPQGAQGGVSAGAEAPSTPTAHSMWVAEPTRPTQAMWHTHQQQKWPKCQLATQLGTVCDPEESLVTFVGEPGIN